MAPGAWYPAPGAPGATPATPESAASERTALTYVVWAGILIVVASVLSTVASLTTSGTSTSIHLGTTFVAFAFAGGACEFLVVALFYLALRRLAVFDARFVTPSRLTLILGIMIALLLIALAPLISTLNQLESCVSNAGTNQTAVSACVTTGSAIALLGVAGVVGIVALVGFIGLLLGIWRLGARYSGSYFKAGAILLIFPFLNIIGGVLIVVSARSAQGPPSPVGSPPR